MTVNATPVGSVAPIANGAKLSLYADQPLTGSLSAVDAAGNSLTIRLGGASAGGEDVVFSSSGRTITFHGFLKAYVESTDDADAMDAHSVSRHGLLAGG